MNNQPFIEVLRRHAPNFSPVVAFDPSNEKIISLDFTDRNQDITADILDDIKKFTNYINQKLK